MVEIGPGCKPCILDCEIYACSSAIYIGAGGDPMIENNKIHDNHIGVETDEEAIGLLRKNQLTGKQTRFQNCRFSYDWNEDMFLNATTQDDDEF
jgi:parallel beta-helix repeat protein